MANPESDTQACTNSEHYRKLAAAQMMAAAIDLLVYRGRLDERSFASDARLVFGDPFSEEAAVEILHHLR